MCVWHISPRLWLVLFNLLMIDFEQTYFKFDYVVLTHLFFHGYSFVPGLSNCCRPSHYRDALGAFS